MDLPIELVSSRIHDEETATGSELGRAPGVSGAFQFADAAPAIAESNPQPVDLSTSSTEGSYHQWKPKSSVAENSQSVNFILRSREMNFVS